MDLGLELLMNPKKKSSDASSVCSGSVRSIKLPSIENVSQSDDVSQITDDDFGDDDAYNRSDKIERIQVNNADYDSEDSISTMSYQQSGHNQMPPQFQHSKMFHNKPSRTPSLASRSSYSESIVSKSELESLGSVLATGNMNKRQEQPRMSEEEIIIAKRELLYQFDRLEKKGHKLPRKFTMASTLDDMKAEYERLKRDKELDNAIRFQRRAVMFFTSGVELLTNKFDGLGVNLDGWSESVNDNIDEYDDTFEELYNKYKSKAKMAPELKLLFGLGMSAFTFNMTRSMMKSMPGIDQVFKQNPELMKQFAAAAANTMKQEQPQGGLFSSLGGIFSNLFGGASGGTSSSTMMPPPQQPPHDNNQQYFQQQTQQTFNMKGPGNIDDIIRDIEGNDNDRIEIMSTVTSSEFTELEDDVNMNNIMYGKKKKAGGRKITLDI